MSMQIQSIVLYNHSGEKRFIDFNLGTINVITGDPNTGKSTIIYIVEYCLGHADFTNIPSGPIREKVAFYGVLFYIGEKQVFVAKAPPLINKTTQHMAYYVEGVNVNIPDLNELIPRYQNEDVRTNITRLLEATKQIETTIKYGFDTTIKNVTCYLFQHKTIIASNTVLFHRQVDEAKSIRETLPYFLGAVTITDKVIKQNLSDAKQKYRKLATNINRIEDNSKNIVEQGRRLLSEAKNVGLINVGLVIDNMNFMEMQKILHQICNEWNPVDLPLITDEQLPGLREEIRNLQQQSRQKAQDIKAIETDLRHVQSYSGEANQHVMRLESINLFDGRTNDMFAASCPLCFSLLSGAPIPQASQIGEALRKIKEDLSIATQEPPMLEKYIGVLREEHDQIKQRIIAAKQEIDNIEQLQIAIDSERQSLELERRKVQKVVDRIEYYLETSNIEANLEILKKELNDLNTQIIEYEKQLEQDSIEDSVKSKMNIIATDMTSWATKLDLEYKGSYRFDEKKLTVIADTMQSSTPMEEMGGRDNWLGCHLIAHLALHKYFVNTNRPVPNFLILDQPIQGYFELEDYNNSLPFSDEIQRDKIIAMFDLIKQVCNDLQNKLQIIILERKNLEEFSPFLLPNEGRWEGGKALIPQEWL